MYLCVLVVCGRPPMVLVVLFIWSLEYLEMSWNTVSEFTLKPSSCNLNVPKCLWASFVHHKHENGLVFMKFCEYIVMIFV